MDKRSFIKITGLATAGAIVAPSLTFCSDGKDKKSAHSERNGSPFALADLPYGYAALEPHIDAATMELHHSRHHAAYTNNLNKALESIPELSGKRIGEILETVNSSDAHRSLRNNGGGYFNHNLFWDIMSPSGGGNPTGAVAEAISAAFGSWESCREAMTQAAITVFGSGWAWLCKGGDGALFVCATPNQDNPLMKQVTDRPGTPLIGLDVWEHAYYLKHQNRRGEYVESFFNVLNWDAVNRRLSQAG